MIQSGFKGEALTIANKNLAVERGICTEEAECSLIGEIVIVIVLVILI